MYKLEVDGHDVHLIKRPGARGAFTHSVADAVVNALLAEQMAASLQRRTLEVVAANRTKSECLVSLALAVNQAGPL